VNGFAMGLLKHTFVTIDTLFEMKVVMLYGCETWLTMNFTCVSLRGTDYT